MTQQSDDDDGDDGVDDTRGFIYGNVVGKLVKSVENVPPSF